MLLQESGEWIMNTSVNDHLHEKGGILDCICNNHNSHHIVVGYGSKNHVPKTIHTTFPIKSIY